MTNPPAGSPLFPQPCGVVSYTYRREFQENVAATLDRIGAVGIRDVEFSSLFGLSAGGLRRLLDERAMTCSSFGVSYADLQERTAAVALDAKALGARFVRVAWIPHESPFSPLQAQSLVETVNRVGKILRAQHDLTFCFHNHGFEFVPFGDETLMDFIVQQSDPGSVSFELDILWAFFPGQDPAALLRRYPTRFRLLHLKDLRKGAVGDLTGGTSQENDVALGDGQIDIPDVLRAAHSAGVEHYYLEDESSSVDVQVPRSIAYLKSLRWT